MNPPVASYRKLPGPSWSLAGRSQLWLADDHLLEVNRFVLVERYRRYFLHEVHALIVQQTKLSRGLTIVFSLLAALPALLAAGFIFAAVQVKTEPEAQILMWVLGSMAAAGAFLFFVLLVIHLSLGPTCSCVIHTAAGSYALEAPARLRRAQQLLAEVVPRIEAAQDGLRAAPSVTTV